MAAEDSTLRLQLVVDGVSKVKAGMEEAAAAVEKSSARAQATVAANLRAQGRSVEEVKEIYGQLGFKGEVAAKEIAAAFETSTDHVASASERTATAAERAGKTSARGMTEARQAASDLGRQFGVALPQSLQTFLARSETIAPVLATAFSAVALVGFVSILAKLPGMIEGASNALAGFGERQRKAYEEAIAANLRLIDENRRLADAQDAARTIGVTGLERQRIETENVERSTRRLADQVAFLLREMNANEAEVRRLTSGWELWVTALTFGLTGRDAEIKRMNEAMEQQRSILAGLESDLRKLRELEADLAKAREAEARREEARTVALARLETERSVGEARIAFAETVARQIAAAGIIGLEEETAALRSAQEQRIELTRNYFERRLALVRTAAERIAIEAERERAAITGRAGLRTIDARTEADQRAAEARMAEARIAAAKKVADAQLNAERQWISDSIALRRVSVDEELALTTQLENERYEAERRSLEARLAEAEKEPLKKRDLIISLNADLEALEIDHQSKLDSIRNAAAAKVADQARAYYEQQVRAAESAANQQLRLEHERIGTRVRLGEVGLRSWEAMERAAIQRWYETQRTVLDQALEHARLTFGEMSLEYQRLMERMRRLNEEQALAEQRINSEIQIQNQQMYERMTEDFNRALTSWIVGYQSLREAASDALIRMTSVFVENLLRQAQAMVVNAILGKTLAKDSIIKDAKVVAARAFRSVMEALPFPANVIVAPVAAAGAFTTVMSFASFEKGGIMPDTDIALLHRNEMVLPEKISRGFQAMFERGQAPVVGPAPHVTYAPTFTVMDARDVERVLEREREVVSKIVRQEMRAGRLPSL